MICPASWPASGGSTPSASASAYPLDRGQRGAQLVGDGHQEGALPVLADHQRAVQLVERAAHARPGHDQRHPGVVVVRAALASLEAVLTQVEPVVRREHDVGVRAFRAGEVLADLDDLVVQRLHHPHPVAQIDVQLHIDPLAETGAALDLQAAAVGPLAAHVRVGALAADVPLVPAAWHLVRADVVAVEVLAEEPGPVTGLVQRHSVRAPLVAVADEGLVAAAVPVLVRQHPGVVRKPAGEQRRAGRAAQAVGDEVVPERRAVAPHASHRGHVLDQVGRKIVGVDEDDVGFPAAGRLGGSPSGRLRSARLQHIGVRRAGERDGEQHRKDPDLPAHQGEPSPVVVVFMVDIEHRASTKSRRKSRVRGM